MKHTVARNTVVRNGAARSQLSLGMFVGLAWLVSNHVMGCGDSSSDSPNTSVNGNQPGGQSPGGAGTSGNAAVGTPGGGNSPGSENTPNNIALDPARDQSEPINLVASGAVQCGGAGTYCVAPNGTCCITAAPAGGMGGGNTFSCAANADGCPDGTTVTQACSSKNSCGSAQVCCRTGGGGMMGGGGNATSCESTCAMGSVQVCLEDAECGAGNQCNGNGTCGPVPCTSTSCGGGQICCRGQGGGAQNVCVAADAAGACPTNQRKVCATAADCPTDFTCAAAGGNGGGNGNGGGAAGGGVLVCTAPACTLTSCMTGQVCCVGGQVGGTPACSAASDTGTCPGNSRLLCATDVDCAPTPGTFCLPAPNGGMGALSCRVPPPPPGDAGVGDAG
ncbi:MAG: hypothetical protein RL033_6385 [Pseudomonadota bacterium]|jgi:hypothetical protein